MPTIFDNINSKLTEGLLNSLEVSHRADFCVGYFNLRGWKEIADQIDKFSGSDEQKCRLLVGMQKQPDELLRDYFSTSANEPIDNQTAWRIKKDLARSFREQLTIGVPTEEDEIGLRKLSNQIKNGKVIVKLFLRYPLHAKLYLAFRNDKINPIIGFVGSSNLTLAGLVRQGELNVDVIEQDAAKKLSDWFNDRWNDRYCIDISKELAEIIHSSWASEVPYNPYLIYLKIAYHLSQEARAGLSEFKIPRVFNNELLEFQQKAVLIAAHHLNKREGVIIGDVVGLGKTIIACALAKIFEDDFYLETLIICPKNIVDMWEKYVHRYQLRAKVMSISRVQNELPNLRRYRVVVIDESHNLRNREGKRYGAIKEYIAMNASKVILLSATPYNKSYYDLSNQLRLFLDEDADLGIAPENFIRACGGRTEFLAKYQYSERSLLAFEKSNFADDWRELMRLYLVRRTRSFIKENYAKYDTVKKRKYLEFADGKRSYFPDRIPKKVEYSFNEKDPDDQYSKLYSDDVVSKLNDLNLPRYGLANYIIEKLPSNISDKEKVIISNLSRAGKRLMGFARTNLFKRLESSGYSFLLSISRHILRNYIFTYALENNLPIPIGGQELMLLDEFLDDKDENSNNDTNNLIFEEKEFKDLAQKIYQKFATTQKDYFDWLKTEYFKPELLKHLKSDSQNLLKILDLGKDWDPKKDSQLNALYQLCTNTHPDKKILIFTQFADTANYLFNEFNERGLAQLECVTGDSDNPTYIANRFSPISNEMNHIKGTPQEIRVLISTDVLSEGQNLQDCHIIVNYDLPWAIIRLIQRAGRVDRIGQQSDQIFCYSFLPADGVEKIIRLRKRLAERIQQNAEVVGSDETFFEGDPVNVVDLYNEKAGLLDDEDDSDVDLASYAFQIWKNALDKNPDLESVIPNLPNVIYSTKKEKQETDAKDAVIVYAKTSQDNDLLVMVDTNGELITQSQYAILKKADCKEDEQPLSKLENHHKLVAKGIEYIRETESLVGGQLGKKNSARYRVYHRLSRYFDENKDTLFANDSLKKVIDEIYTYPLKEYAKETFNRQLKAGIDDSQLAALAISLREEDKLCIINEEEIKHTEPQIICSLGLKYVP
ncbi:helicase-related protein [Stygiobacter electus]|uniref:Helicase-related protein n=1 Tax=Stygiobacter electus TaxID=3032292 RepID=A0AAE3TEM5_9BACT|nr:helicase-related protein [Stygiobacter electus]MDF1612527.1 helicase-related protein [Stygiobacter electus]